MRKLRGRMMPPPGRPRPDEAAYDLGGLVSRDVPRPGCRGPSQCRTNRHLPAAQSNGIPERHPGPARARRRCLGAAPEGRCEPWLRQCRRRRAVADAARAVSGRRAKSQPPRRRQPPAIARQPCRRAAGGPDAGGSPRRPAARDAGRNGRALYVPARWRVRHPGPLVARSQRERRRPHRGAPVGAVAGRQAAGAVDGQAEPEPERDVLR